MAVQKYIMARILAKGQDGFRAAIENETTTMSRTGEHTKTGTMATLRSLAREQYRLDMSKSERAEAREAANGQDANSDLEPSVAVVEATGMRNGTTDAGIPITFAIIWSIKPLLPNYGHLSTRTSSSSLTRTVGWCLPTLRT